MKMETDKIICWKEPVGKSILERVCWKECVGKSLLLRESMVRAFGGSLSKCLLRVSVKRISCKSFWRQSV
jgi:hypothetical protein